MKNKVLFVTEKFCDGTPDLGWTNNFHNLFNTFSHDYGSSCNWNTIHLDEALSIYGIHINNLLPSYCEKWGINIIIYSLLGQSPVNPSLEVYAKIKKMGIFQCFMWPDTGPGWGTETIKIIKDLGDLHVSWDNPCSEYHDRQIPEKNHVNLWVPQDKSLFYKQEEQDIQVSFIGSPRYYDRQVLLNELIRANIKLVIQGGQREGKLSPEHYAQLIRRSKIGLNFSLSPANFFQTKGRVFEILACGSMLLEYKNPATAKLFTPNIDYIEFENSIDLINKIKYFSENEEERAKIAENGYKTYQKKYTSKLFWDFIMDKANNHKTII
jgi:glycosyltransferase involved in cell wall biosynthesis